MTESEKRYDLAREILSKAQDRFDADLGEGLRLVMMVVDMDDDGMEVTLATNMCCEDHLDFALQVALESNCFDDDEREERVLN